MTQLDSDYQRNWKPELDTVTAMLSIVCAQLVVQHGGIEKYELAAGNVEGLAVWWLERQAMDTARQAQEAAHRDRRKLELQRQISAAEGQLRKFEMDG